MKAGTVLGEEIVILDPKRTGLAPADGARIDDGPEGLKHPLNPLFTAS
jgi:hypothetical protein